MTEAWVPPPAGQVAGPYGRLGEDEKVEVNSFRSGSAYVRALLQTPKRCVARMGATWTREAEMEAAKSHSGADMKRHLNWFDMFCFGVGSIVGGGIFISSGEVAHDLAGPAIIVSYAIAGMAALLSAMCFAEFAVEIPSAGGAYSYIRIAFGEFVSFLAGCAIIGGLLSGPPAIARAFTSYLCTVFGNDDTNAWRIHVEWLPENLNELDFPAVGLLLLLTGISCYSSKESSTFNIITTIVHIGFILFIIVAGFVYGNAENLVQASSPSYPSGFFPYGLSGVFSGASVAFFSYIGYDCVATMAEECDNPGFTMPTGIVGSLLFSGAIFCSMVASLVYLQPYNLIDVDAPYAVAFDYAGVRYATQIVGIGAVLGTITASMTGIISSGRYLTAMGRAVVIPPWFAKVNAKTGTPINAHIAAFIPMALVGLFVDTNVLVNINSALVLFAYSLVAAALIVYRSHTQGGASLMATYLYLTAFIVTTIAFTFVYQLNSASYGALIALGGLCIIETATYAFMCCRQVPSPRTWGVPCMPYFAALSVFTCVFLLGSFNVTSDANPLAPFACILGAAVLMYLLYSVHASWDYAHSIKPSPEIEIAEK